MKVDCHCDTALYLREEDSLRSLPKAHMDYLRVHKYLDLSFWAIFIDEGKYLENTSDSFQEVLARLNQDIAENADLVAPLLYRDQLDVGEVSGSRTLLLVAAEGASVLGEDCEYLDDYYAAGLRSIGPTWNYTNQYAGGSATEAGFTQAGLRLIDACNNKGILIDGAHLNRKSFWQLVEYTDTSFIVSHSCCAALSNEEIYQYRRNLDDEQMLALADLGGVMGIAFVDDFLGGAGDLVRLCEHIEYAVSLIGSNHVALGSDFDGCVPHPELAGVEKLPNIYQELNVRGMKKEDLDNIAGNSVVRLLKEVLPQR